MYLDRDNPQDYPLKDQVNCIREIGAEQVIISSDAGQVSNPSSSESLSQYIGLLADNGLGEDEFRAALIDNPGRVLGI